MARLKVRCRKCGAEYCLGSATNMHCRKCEDGLLVRVNSHFDKRVAKAKRDYISDIVEYSYKAKQ